MCSSHFTVDGQHGGRHRKREYVNRCLATSKASQRSRCQRLIIHFTFVHKLTVCVCAVSVVAFFSSSFLFYAFMGLQFAEAKAISKMMRVNRLRISLFRPVTPIDWASVWPRPFSNLAMNSAHNQWTSALFMECLLATEWLINASAIKWHINCDWEYVFLFAFTWNFVERNHCVCVFDGHRRLYAKSIKWQFEICAVISHSGFHRPVMPRVAPRRIEKNILIKPKKTHIKYTTTNGAIDKRGNNKKISNFSTQRSN